MAAMSPLRDWLEAFEVVRPFRLPPRRAPRIEVGEYVAVVWSQEIGSIAAWIRADEAATRLGFDRLLHPYED